MQTKKAFYIVYSKMNQAYFVMFFEQVLRICNDKIEADEYLASIVNQ